MLVSSALLAFVAASVSVSSVGASPVVARAGLPILVGNDDGWAEANIRAFYQELKKAGYNTLVSAPAYDESGTGSSTSTPSRLTSPGEFNSIPSGAPAEGHDSSDAHLWYVNGYPVDAINYGLNTLSSTYLGGKPALVVTGPNVGTNLGLATLGSGTVGAATAAAKAGIPAIAFSADTGDQVSYTTLATGDSAYIYADASVRLVKALITGGGPYLPAGTTLNVNYPAAGAGTSCTSGASFKFVLSRLYSLSGATVATCGANTLPTESSVVARSGCYASVTVMAANDKLDTSKANQAAVLQKLGSFLSC